MADPDALVLVSAASAWEIAIKHQSGKLRVPDLIRDFRGTVQREGFVALPISMEHAVRAATLSGKHKDPFDRMLIAQAQIEDVAIVTRDDRFRTFAVHCLW